MKQLKNGKITWSSTTGEYQLEFIDPDKCIYCGKEAKKELIQPWFETLDMSHEILETEIVTDNNIAYARIEYRDSFSSKEGGETILMHNKALWIFRREAEDTWKIIRNMWNRNPPGTEHHLKFNPFWVK